MVVFMDSDAVFRWVEVPKVRVLCKQVLAFLPRR